MKIDFTKAGIAGQAAAVSLLLLATMLGANAQPAPDAQLNQGLVGSWTPVLDPREQVAWVGSRSGIFVVEEFGADGTGQTTVFRGHLCSAKFRVTRFYWHIRQGILVTDEPDGEILRDAILSLASERFAIRSLDDGTVAHRIRRDPCNTSGT